MDHRTPLNPDQAAAFKRQYPEVELVVQSSPIRCYSDADYTAKGVKVVDDISDCDVLMGVKEVPVPQLISDKTYLFFSHTIKEQPYNRELLRRVLEQNIRLIDYELLRDKKAQRLIGFGRYAGLVGAYNGIRAFGLRKGLFELPFAHDCFDLEALKRELDKIELPPLKIVLTGKGRVGRGAREILNYLGLERVSKEDFLDKEYPYGVFTHLSTMDYFVPNGGGRGKMKHYLGNHHHYKSEFYKYAKVANIFIAGHFWEEPSPYLLTKEHLKDSESRLEVVADISCDIAGPIASTIRPSTINDPLYGYDPQSGSEVSFDADGAVTVMAVDNLPCELPRDASTGFGEMLLEHILPSFMNGDKSDILHEATIAQNGQLEGKYNYLESYVSFEEPLNEL